MTNNKTQPIMALFLCLCLPGCINEYDGTLRWIDDSVVVANLDEVRKKQKILLDAKGPEDLENIIDEGIVFDGTVTKVSTNAKTGLRVSELQVDRILFSKFINQKFIVIHTPSAKKGGVGFQVNKKYRVHAIYLNNAFRTWTSSGTVEIQN